MGQLSCARILIEDLQKSYGRTQILSGVNLEARAGSVTAILGENGVGKTTLLSCILGLQRYSGRIRVEGGQAGSLPTFGVLDRFLLYPRWTVRQNLTYFLNGLKYMGHPALESLVPRSWYKARAGVLSTGQVKLVTLGIAFASQAQVLLLDEFVNGLDLLSRDAVHEVINYVCREESRIVIATGHDLAVLEEVATHTHILSRGRLVDVTGEISEERSMREVYRDYLLRSRA